MRRIIFFMTFLSCLILSTLSSAEGIGLPQGRFVQVEQHRMHIDCTGTGDVTVVVDAGIGGSSVDWWLVRQELDSSMRFCAYDRAGYGWSDPGFSARTSENITRELTLLLEAAEESGPYLLVGHSFGGFTARLFTAQHPDEVIGLVLVDASHPDQTERMQQLRTGTSKRTNALNPLQIPATSSIDSLPEPLRTQSGFLNSRRKAIFAQMDEIKYFEESAQQVRDANLSPDLPISVITRGQRAWPKDEHGEAMEDAWRSLQASMTSLSRHGVQRMAESSGHNIHLDQPTIISEEIQRLLSERDVDQLRADVVEINH